MTSDDGSWLVEFVVRSTVVSTEKLAEVIDKSAPRIYGVLSNRGVVVVSGGVEYDNGAIEAVTLKTFTCNDIGARGKHGECRDRCGGGKIGGGRLSSCMISGEVPGGRGCRCLNGDGRIGYFDGKSRCLARRH